MTMYVGDCKSLYNTICLYHVICKSCCLCIYLVQFDNNNEYFNEICYVYLSGMNTLKMTSHVNSLSMWLTILISSSELSCLCLRILYHKALFHVHWTSYNEYQACIALFAISMFKSHYDF